MAIYRRGMNRIDDPSRVPYPSIETRLHMYSYYSTVAWQIFAIVASGGAVLATIPFFVKSTFIDMAVFRAYWIFNETFAVLLVAIGGLFYKRNMELGRRWVYFQNENYYQSANWLIDWIEIGKPSIDQPKI